MSEKILEVLMRLFAVFATYDSNIINNKLIVERFLKQQALRRNSINHYLNVFEKELEQLIRSTKGKSVQKKELKLSTLITTICASLSQELSQVQRVFILVRILEFCKSDKSLLSDSEIELQAILQRHVANILNITVAEEELYLRKRDAVSDESREQYSRDEKTIREFEQLRDFVLNDFDEIPFTENILVINNIKSKEWTHPIKHIYSESLTGEIKVYKINITNTLIFRSKGVDKIRIHDQLVLDDVINFLSNCSINSRSGTIYYSQIQGAFFNYNQHEKIVFEAKDIEYEFRGGKKGLQRMSFREESGHMVAIMGASGAGKSTLLNVLNGANMPSHGSVTINGINIYNDIEGKLKGQIGYVSQDDLLIEELTVFQNLYYNAKLCFADDTEAELTEKVNEVLKDLGLTEQSNLQVGSPMNKKISGGQRKRLNIALELIRKPAVLFLDEPTSGLSSRDSERIMITIKELSLKGNLVFVVIHQPSSEIYKLFDKLIILGKGGYQVYYGDPIESIIYFNKRNQDPDWAQGECELCHNVDSEQIFNIIESNKIDVQGNETDTLKYEAVEWNEMYQYYELFKKYKRYKSKTKAVNHFKIQDGNEEFNYIYSKLNNFVSVVSDCVENENLSEIQSLLKENEINFEELTNRTLNLIEQIGKIKNIKPVLKELRSFLEIIKKVYCFYNPKAYKKTEDEIRMLEENEVVALLETEDKRIKEYQIINNSLKFALSSIKELLIATSDLIIDIKDIEDGGNLDDLDYADEIIEILLNLGHLNQLKEIEIQIAQKDAKIKVPKITFKTPDWFNQFKIFVKRDVLSKLKNTQYITINALESPIIAVFLAYIIKYWNVDVNNELGYVMSDNDNLPVYIFMTVICAIFVGLTVSAEEIIADRRILKRESFLNLSRSSYLVSKVFILLVISAIQSFAFVLIGNTILEIRGMYFEYWLVAFSTWSCANMLGLNISDSFKTAVTIYILIPFLVIPQIILSGIIVKFDKLNPSISNPKDIPIYGEVMTSRWAYEALSVKQFKDNEYEQLFYPWEKAMSQADYKKNYWIKTLENKLNSCNRDINKPGKKDKVVQDLILIKNEITDELKRSQRYKYDYLESLTYDKFNSQVYNATLEFFSEVKQYNNKWYNIASSNKDKIINELQKTEELKDAFIMLKKTNYNENLSEFCRNSNEVERIVEYDGKLYQKIDPIFQDTEYPFLRAHFYAPQKRIFSLWIDTFWANVIVIWLMSIILYITLYYKVLKGFLDWIERFSEKFSKNKD